MRRLALPLLLAGALTLPGCAALPVVLTGLDIAASVGTTIYSAAASCQGPPVADPTGSRVEPAKASIFEPTFQP